MTRAIRDALRAGGFRNPAFVELWDIAFAQLYFDALRFASSGSPQLPRAWAALRDARKRRRVVLPLIDCLFGRRDDELALWSISRARDAAWGNTQLLWILRDRPDEQRRHMDIVDGVVGFAGRGLLRPLYLPSSLSQLTLFRPATA